jgi:hypothetical protein
MRAELFEFEVRSRVAPVVEVDSEAGAVYVRFSRARIARTVARPTRMMHVAVDLDAGDRVVGIEAVGVKEFSLSFILKAAQVQAPTRLLDRARYVPVAMADA